VDDIKLADLEPLIGSDLDVEVAGDIVPLSLVAAVALPHGVRISGSFRLEFRGPYEPLLPQGTYRFRTDELTMDIFIVPLKHNEAGVEYEAIFN
jgi:hypothetical protein